MDSVESVEKPAFDHLLHWVRDVPAAVAEYRAAGLPAHSNPVVDGFQNGGWRLDARYIEILSVTDHGDLHRSRYERRVELLTPAIDALRGGNGAITFAINVTDARSTAKRLRDLGYEVAEFDVDLFEHGVSFVEVFAGCDRYPWMPFFITYDPPREQIHGDIAPGTVERGPYDLAALQITSIDPPKACAELSTVLGIDPVDATIPLPGGTIEFVSGDREAITAVSLTGAHAGADIHGLSFRATGR
ncbi:VOC family protein [Millisia brevis]|uniref:VOC family protein n=1 Tax=Millisia brevis TaxID=264148 RepID=UPI000834BE0B|nr:VOC family protein [Millisia brevis]